MQTYNRDTCQYLYQIDIVIPLLLFLLHAEDKGTRSRMYMFHTIPHRFHLETVPNFV